MKIQHYECRVVCGNCGCVNTMSIVWGVRVSHARCPVCGCQTLERAHGTTGRPDPADKD